MPEYNWSRGLHSQPGRVHDRVQVRRSPDPEPPLRALSGHKLRKGQEELINKLLPQIEVPAQGKINSPALFGDDRPLHFEIGFGSGEHLADRADMLPDHGFIGAEPFLNGVAAALVHIRDKQLRNVRLWRGDALEVLAAGARWRVELPLFASSRPLAEGPPCQTADGQ